ncbi:hypothetical protein C2845_PM04G16970 [Panicum miliaceum]|uniref:Uncharacterized protein n=1 Tax=Panicum miliaceum TaxID=4540 RepID=A0A3L6QKA8_PANMI|nr:hypothetical protein C2845_PM04G16970 [Panicum miliaceum]
MRTEYSSMMTNYPLEMYQENGGSYYGAVEPGDETTGYLPADDMEDDGYGADVEQQQPHLKNKCISDDVYIADFDDNISKECFNNARDCIDCEFEYPELGVDDTDMTEDDLGEEFTEPGDLVVGSDLLELDGVERKDSENENFVSNEQPNLTAGLLGGCGCVHQEIAQEISDKHLEEVSLGFRKRNRNPKCTSEAHCRRARDMGAMEIALRTRCHRLTECIFMLGGVKRDGETLPATRICGGLTINSYSKYMVLLMISNVHANI